MANRGNYFFELLLSVIPKPLLVLARASKEMTDDNTGKRTAYSNYRHNESKCVILHRSLHPDDLYRCLKIESSMASKHFKEAAKLRRAAG